MPEGNLTKAWMKACSPQRRFRSAIASMAAFVVLAGMQNGFAADEETGEKSFSEISLQRTPCYGSCPIDKVVLKADGSATFTGMGNTGRTGDYEGSFWRPDFDLLAKWMEAQEFFGMDDLYGRPNIDSSEHILRAVRDGKEKAVTNCGNKSLAAWGMEQAILGFVSKIKWTPVDSGIRGAFLFKQKVDESPEVEKAHPYGMVFVHILRDGEKQGYRFSTDEEGRFDIPLRPGKYQLTVDMGKKTECEVTVEEGKVSVIRVMLKE